MCVRAFVLVKECAANANAKSKSERANVLALFGLWALCIGIHTTEIHHEHAPLGQRCRRWDQQQQHEQHEQQEQQQRAAKREARIFLLYFKLLMSGLFSY